MFNSPQTLGPGETLGAWGDEPVVSLKPDMMLANRYRLIEEIGRGGMGVVWKAEERTAERNVVLKFVPHEIKNFADGVEQFKVSFKTIHELQHPHICPVYTLEEDLSLGCYHVMKWLDGETLDQYVNRTVGKRQPLPFDEVLRILSPVAEALDYAHNNRIVHRDIKPSNIFLVLDETKNIKTVQVIDFGLASDIRSALSQKSQVSQTQLRWVGTPLYMAPEQWRAEPLSESTDQYALAAVAYKLLSGYLPFDSDNSELLRMAVTQDPPKPIPTMPEHVNGALLKALAKDAGQRFETCTEFIAALSEAVVHRAPGVSQGPPTQKAGDLMVLPIKLFETCTKFIAALTGAVVHRAPGISQDPPDRKAGDRMVLPIKGVEYAFRWCPAGTFLMGTISEDLRRVTLSQGFWMLETQVTQSMWESVMGYNPSIFRDSVSLPVEQVSWYDCQEYIKKLNTHLAGTPGSDYRFSLPTAAQWEYACRAGTTSAYHFGNTLDENQANFSRNIGRTCEVGRYPANAWGLYDMHGNVCEWTLSRNRWSGENVALFLFFSVITCGIPLLWLLFSFNDRQTRGGSWISYFDHCTSAYSYTQSRSRRDCDLGVRLALVRVE